MQLIFDGSFVSSGGYGDSILRGISFYMHNNNKNYVL